MLIIFPYNRPKSRSGLRNWFKGSGTNKNQTMHGALLVSLETNTREKNKYIWMKSHLFRNGPRLSGVAPPRQSCLQNSMWAICESTLSEYNGSPRINTTLIIPLPVTLQNKAVAACGAEWSEGQKGFIQMAFGKTIPCSHCYRTSTMKHNTF